VTGSGALRSPNIWDHPQIYELENSASDRDGVLLDALDRLHPLAGARVADLGCGTGFHLPLLASRGALVVGVEPHAPLVAAAARRGAAVRASAAALPFADASLDVAHARWAYFFGAGSEPGLAELARVLRPGGVAALIDNDATRSTFGRWFRDAYPAYDPVAVQRFWDRQGFTTELLTIEWRFTSRADLESVVRIELPPAAAERALETHEGTTVDYAVALRWRQF
jgi:SAM-dependent methyltransferase